MRLCSVDLTNFRNYDRLQLAFPEGTHILYGANAQGKTNLLEAIHLCASLRSHRTNRDEELVRHDADFYRTDVAFKTDRGLDETLSVEYRLPASRGDSPSRIIRYNGLLIDRLADMMGLFHAILFAPEDLQIVKGGPVERRRFINHLISRTDRVYFRDLQDYGRIIGQRNRLLKRLKNDGAPGRDLAPMAATELDVWDETLAQAASTLLEKRLAFVETLSENAALSLHHLTASRETLDIAYKGFPGLEDDMDRPAIYDAFLGRLRRSREDDIFRGNTSTGPHRDDLLISLNGVDARLYASQGQQRSIVLALKIAELILLREISGEKPILLLDDVMSELDQSRRARLLEVIAGHQVFITCTDPDQAVGTDATHLCDIDWPGPIHFYRVHRGTVTPVDLPEALSEPR
ncbi:MAG: DNA replication/repair protein RecF [Saccharofermentanales bacterium]|jgi:DNA replication and repair protein RecF